jgi:hypothetical protein
MPDSTTPYTESGNPGETRASATTLGSGRPPARRGKLARRILFALLGLTLIVTANFKETQMTHMWPGQHVKVFADAYDREYDGHIDSIAGASGTHIACCRRKIPPEITLRLCNVSP